VKPDDLDPSVPAGAGLVPAWALRVGQPVRETQEAVVDEEPVAIEINGISHAVMLVSPVDLEDFALGFMLTEGLIEGAADLLDVEAEAGADGIVLHVSVTARREADFKTRRRALSGRTGCGLCGVESLDQLALADLDPVPAGPALAVEALTRAMRALAARQPLQRLTGAAHAAAWCRPDGEAVLVREDVGRHNALDKLVGALARAGLAAAGGFVAVTSRASVEMVHKAASAGAPLLAAVSAPTRRAVALADRVGLTLAGFVRAARATIYTPPERLR